MLLALLVPTLFAAPTGDLAALLPKVPGWTPQGSGRYSPDTLFEYINGAADGFLDCGFVELLTQTYEGPEKKLITVELYRHSSPLTAFGIYSQEKPRIGTFLPLGGQGYVEDGILNFFKGDCYVKLSGNHLGPQGRDLLQRFAKDVAARIPGEGRVPAILDAFPKAGRLQESERFLLKNVLGHAFLHDAFVVDYGTPEKGWKLMALQGKEPEEAAAMAVQLCKAMGSAAPLVQGQPLALQDEFSGVVTLLLSGRHLLLVVGGDATTHTPQLLALHAGIKQRG